MASTSINITCYDRDGNIVKQVASDDEGNIEDPEDDGGDDNTGGGGATGGNPL